MMQRTRTVTAFLLAPAVPALPVYLFYLLRGFGDGSIVTPMILVLLGYVAMLTMGIAAHRFMQRRQMRSLSAYAKAGALLGAVFCLGFIVLNTYPAKLMFVLPGAVFALLVAMAYAAAAAVVFWFIALSGGEPQKNRLPAPLDS
jgi:spore maturation protein SpmA